MASVINQIKLGNTEYAIAASAYAECTTAAATAAKIATICTDSDTTNTAFTLVKGVSVQVKFSNTNSASNPTLNVNSTGAKSIYYKGAAITASYLKANYIYTFVYDGTQWNLVGEINTDTNTQRAYYTSNPAMNGTASAGSSTSVSRGDHVHPTDTSRAPTSHASSSSTYGLGTTANYGHVKISNGDVNTVASASGLAAGMDHTHSNYVAKDTNGGIQVEKVTGEFLNLSGTVSAGIGVSDIDNDVCGSNIIIRSEGLWAFSGDSEYELGAFGSASLSSEKAEIDIRRANYDETGTIDYGIYIEDDNVIVGKPLNSDNDPEYDPIYVKLNADEVDIDAEAAKVNGSKIMTAADFKYNSSTGTLYINIV